MVIFEEDLCESGGNFDKKFNVDLLGNEWMIEWVGCIVKWLVFRDIVWDKD